MHVCRAAKTTGCSKAKTPSPWDDDKFQLLQAFYDILRKQPRWNHSTFVTEKEHLENPTLDRGLLLRGTEDAIIQHQRHVLFYFLRLLEILDQYDQIHESLLPGRLYRSAVIHNWKDSTFIWRLIETNAASLSNEPIVLQWAYAASASGDHLGSWILEFINLRSQTPAKLHKKLAKLTPLPHGRGEKYRDYIYIH